MPSPTVPDPADVSWIRNCTSAGSGTVGDGMVMILYMVMPMHELLFCLAIAAAG